jgi:2'-5' RNA ligase
VKTHESAVVVIPPGAVWEPIQRIRRVHDSRVRRWMPHVTLLYPFRPRADFAAARPGLERAAARVEPFALVLARFRRFAHGRGRVTAWLEPEPREPLLALESALLAEFPDCDDVARFRGGFTPHLSVGQLAGPQAGEALAALGRGWAPLRFEVASIAAIARAGDEPFRVYEEVALGAIGG